MIAPILLFASDKSEIWNCLDMRNLWSRDCAAFHISLTSTKSCVTKASHFPPWFITYILKKHWQLETMKQLTDLFCTIQLSMSQLPLHTASTVEAPTRSVAQWEITC